MKPQYIVWHTAAHGTPEKNHDTTAAQIDEWHKARGWRGIGYHYVIRLDGTLASGRPLNDNADLESFEIGAHTLGLNNKSVGICFSGHGDYHEHTPEQRKEGLWITERLMERFTIPTENVIGHREVNDLVKRGVLAKEYRTSKTCPGLKVDMDEVRAELAKETGA